MPRRARVTYAGVPQHVIQRGNNRAACFFADGDYRIYLDSLLEGATRYGRMRHSCLCVDDESCTSTGHARD